MEPAGNWPFIAFVIDDSSTFLKPSLSSRFTSTTNWVTGAGAGVGGAVVGGAVVGGAVVGASVGASVLASVGASVGAAMGAAIIVCIPTNTDQQTTPMKPDRIMTARI